MTTSHTKSAAFEADTDATVTALQRGDERVFTELVECWSGVMLRVALAHCNNRAVAEEIVQEAWLTVLRSIARFERRSALRTWIIGIVVNLARSRARAERRLVPLTTEGEEPAVEGGGFWPTITRAGRAIGPLSPCRGRRPNRICSRATPGR